MVPINLALRDVHMEQADVTCSDAWTYNATFDLMTRVVDVINEIDPTLWLYKEILRGKERATLAQTENFLFQYDGMHLDGEDDIDEYRMIWRDFATGWYKHPRRCILATRELSCAEQELLISQLRTEIGAWFEKRRLQVQHPKNTEEEIAAIKRMAEKLGRNGVSGAFLKSTPEGAYPWLFRRLGRQWTEQAAQSDASVEQLFDHLTSDNPTGIQLHDYQEAVRDKILNTPAEPGPKEDLKRPPRRMTQKQYSDYAAAASGSAHTQKIWERIKTEGINIITEEEQTSGEKMGINDLSYLFMYPNEMGSYPKPEGYVPDPLFPEMGDDGRMPDVKVPLAFRELRDEFEHPDLQALLRTLQGDKGPSGPVMVASPSPYDFQSLSRLGRDNPPLTIITSTPNLDNKGDWISEMYRQQDVPTGAFVDGHFGVDPADPKGNVMVRLPKPRPSNGVVSMSYEKAYYPLQWKVPAGTAPAEFVRNGRLRPTKIADMVKFCTFVWRHADNWMDIIQRHHEQMHAIVYRQFKKENS